MKVKGLLGKWTAKGKGGEERYERNRRSEYEQSMSYGCMKMSR
jgi:hypothetical protein